ncbi:polysaccharide pyruvyl transferase family protein [Terasakiispira papahanaumokuakeensis]|nr:polysaccharide pyruvyl transferase family protein [Terasakiispira papahanaumokuakeensis]
MITACVSIYYGLITVLSLKQALLKTQGFKTADALSESRMNVYWWRPDEGTNLGDEITSIVLEQILNQPHQRVGLDQASLLSTGSVLDKVMTSKSFYRRTTPLYVVGSGLIRPRLKPTSLKRRFTLKRWLPDCLDVISVRGCLTQQILAGQGCSVELIGDPGLLMPHIVTPQRCHQYRYGLIPHFTQVDDPQWQALCRRLPNAIMIDFRHEDYQQVIQTMASCDVILSQGLHGLILSDAYQIPNVWISDGALHAGGDFKFLDYFSSIGRSPLLCIQGIEQVSTDRIEQQLYLADKSIVERLQAQVLCAFETMQNKASA